MKITKEYLRKVIKETIEQEGVKTDDRVNAQETGRDAYREKFFGKNKFSIKELINFFNDMDKTDLSNLDVSMFAFGFTDELCKEHPAVKRETTQSKVVQFTNKAKNSALQK